METDILTIKEVAEYLRITEKTAYRRVLAVPQKRDRRVDRGPEVLE